MLNQFNNKLANTMLLAVHVLSLNVYATVSIFRFLSLHRWQNLFRVLSVLFVFIFCGFAKRNGLAFNERKYRQIALRFKMKLSQQRYECLRRHVRYEFTLHFDSIWLRPSET